jgi:hypothetical protein
MLVDGEPMVTSCSFLGFFFVFVLVLLLALFFGPLCNFFLGFKHGKLDQKILDEAQE